MSEPVALKRGRERAKRRRKRAAVKRVREFRRWICRGCPSGECPGVPSNADFKIARGEWG